MMPNVCLGSVPPRRDRGAVLGAHVQVHCYPRYYVVHQVGYCTFLLICMATARPRCDPVGPPGQLVTTDDALRPI